MEGKTSQSSSNSSSYSNNSEVKIPDKSEDGSYIGKRKRIDYQLKLDNIKQRKIYQDNIAFDINCVGYKYENECKKLTALNDNSDFIYISTLNYEIRSGMYKFTYKIESKGDTNLFGFGFISNSDRYTLVLSNTFSYIVYPGNNMVKCKSPVKFENGYLNVVFNINSILSGMYIFQDNVWYEIFKIFKPVKPYVTICCKDDAVNLEKYEVNLDNEMNYLKIKDGICGMKSIDGSSFIIVIIQCLMCNKKFVDEMQNKSEGDVNTIVSNSSRNDITTYFSRIIKILTNYSTNKYFYSDLYKYINKVLNVVGNNKDPLNFLIYLKDILDSKEIKNYAIFKNSKELCHMPYSTDYIVKITDNDTLKISDNTYKLQCLIVYIILFYIRIVFNTNK